MGGQSKDQANSQEATCRQNWLERAMPHAIRPRSTKFPLCPPSRSGSRGIGRGCNPLSPTRGHWRHRLCEPSHRHISGEIGRSFDGHGEQNCTNQERQPDPILRPHSRLPVSTALPPASYWKTRLGSWITTGPPPVEESSARSHSRYGVEVESRKERRTPNEKSQLSAPGNGDLAEIQGVPQVGCTPCALQYFRWFMELRVTR